MTDQLRKIIELLNSKNVEDCKLGLSLVSQMNDGSNEGMPQDMVEACSSAILTLAAPDIKKDLDEMFLKQLFGESNPEPFDSDLLDFLNKPTA